MGYDIYITRSDDWSENAGKEITEAEWREERPKRRRSIAAPCYLVIREILMLLLCVTNTVTL